MVREYGLKNTRNGIFFYGIWYGRDTWRFLEISDVAQTAKERHWLRSDNQHNHLFAMSSHGRGRIRAHERDYDDDVEIIGDRTTNLEGYSEKLRETVKLSMEDSTRKDYRRRIVRMVKFLEEKHPDYAAIGCKTVTIAESNNPEKYYFGGAYKKDLVYRGIDVKMIISFLIVNKMKANGKKKQFVDIRKYKDAVLWGAEIAGERLPLSFYKEIEIFLKGYKRETAKAKKHGGVEDKAADPISTTLYRKILNWGITGGNSFFYGFGL